MRISKSTAILALLSGVLLSSLPAAAQYTARQEGDLVHLEDAKNQTVVSIVTSVGNVAYEMKVKGQNVLHFPSPTIDAFKQRPGLSGIPFLGPWANRLDEPAFYANGKRYAFNQELGNVRGNNPIHGFLTAATQWQVVEVKADATQAWVTSRLDFYRQPAWMAQFPFAHTVEMTYRLRDGVLEVNLKIHNLSADPMPISIGFHPYYQLTDSPRDEWTVSVGARTQWVLAPNLIPTGEIRPIEEFFPDPRNIALKDYNLDHVFGDLIRDSSGKAVMSVRGKTQRLDIAFGPKYRAAVIYAPNSKPNGIPPGRGGPVPAPAATAGAAGASGAGGRGGRGGQPPDRNFICFEPMAGISDAMNLAQKGLYKELQTLAPDATWEESFWVHPSGF